MCTILIYFALRPSYSITQIAGSRVSPEFNVKTRKTILHNKRHDTFHVIIGPGSEISHPIEDPTSLKGLLGAV